MDGRIFDTLTAALKELSWENESIALSRMRQVYEQRLYFVAFIGQYSAGKSCLINNLLGRDILPKGITETTPLLTYIRYGEREQARLHYLDGAVQVLTIEDVAGLVQSAEKWNWEELDYLEVYLQEEFLRQGMVLMDTPGINTLIERHEQLLASSLAVAAEIVYVAGRAPARVDADKLTQLTAQGFDITFVRTHCDEIRTSEESDSQVMEKDYEILASCGVNRDNCCHVSNHSDSRWFASIDPLRQLLVQKGGQAVRELERAAAQQLSVLARRCCTALEEKQALLSAAHNCNEKELEKQRLGLRRQMQMLQNEIKRRQGWLQNQVEACSRTLEGQAARQIELYLKQASETIQRSDAATEAQMEALMRRTTEQLARKVYDTFNSFIDPLVVEINGDFPIDGLSQSHLTLPQAEHYMQVREEQDIELERLREQLKALHANYDQTETRLEAIEASPEFLQLCRDIQSIEMELSQVQAERSGLPPYQPQFIVAADDRPQPSDVARTIGNIADWAMLLIPGEAVGKALIKAPALTKNFAKLIGSGEKIVKIFKKGDSIKDLTFALQNMSKTYATAKRKAKATEIITTAAKGVDGLKGFVKESPSGSFLDYLTFQYWGERIGKNFDRPPRLVIDQEYERRYAETKKQLEQQQQELQRRTYQKKLELDAFKNEEERLKALQESLVINEKKVETELRQREDQLRQAAEQKALADWRTQCADWYQQQVSQQIADTLQSYLEELPVRLNNYQDQRTQAIMERLEQQQAAYQSIAGAAPDEASAALEVVSSLLNQVREYV